MKEEIFFLVFFLFALVFITHSQNTTPAKVPPTTHKHKTAFHSPQKAMLFSTVLPGLGQAYNKKFWKLPVVYAAIGTTVYFFDANNKLFKQYKDAYLAKTDNDSATIDLYPNYTDSQLNELKEYYRRWRDLNAILGGLFYALNIVDAYVDAQLLTFDVSDDLSFGFMPEVNISSSANRKTSGAITLTFTF